MTIATAFFVFGFMMLVFSAIIAMVEIDRNTRTNIPPIFFWIFVGSWVTAFLAWLPWR